MSKKSEGNNYFINITTFIISLALLTSIASKGFFTKTKEKTETKINETLNSTEIKKSLKDEVPKKALVETKPFVWNDDKIQEFIMELCFQITWEIESSKGLNPKMNIAGPSGDIGSLQIIPQRLNDFNRIMDKLLRIRKANPERNFGKRVEIILGKYTSHYTIKDCISHVNPKLPEKERLQLEKASKAGDIYLVTSWYYIYQYKLFDGLDPIEDKSELQKITCCMWNKLDKKNPNPNYLKKVEKIIVK